MTALIDTLFQIEKQLGIELDTLLPYAEADTIGGYHPEESKRKWWTGAIWEVEGQTLYAVIRALKPQTIVEIGSGTGCSSTHMALALYNNQKANNELLKTDGIVGHITTVDRGNTPQIPDFLQAYVTIEAGDGINYLALLPDNSVDFILEDADHTTDMCHAIGELAKTKLKPGGVLFVHDIEHFAVGAEVRAGYDLAGMEVRRYRTDPSDCGWGVWQKPKETVRIVWTSDTKETFEEVKARHKADASPVIDTTVLQAQEEPNAQPVKRTSGKRKAKSAK